MIPQNGLTKRENALGGKELPRRDRRLPTWKTDEFGKSVRDYEMISAFSVQASVPRTTAQGIEFAFGNITVVSAGRIDDDGVFFLFHHFFSAGKTVVHVNLVGVYFENEAVAETASRRARFCSRIHNRRPGCFPV